jgi:hypothetical protein
VLAVGVAAVLLRAECPLRVGPVAHVRAETLEKSQPRQNAVPSPGNASSGASSESQPKHAAYLFAHMMKDDYGRLYYSASTDGLHWTLLNDGNRVLGEEYRGHPDICQGHDGRFYMLGNYSKRPEIAIWVSEGLVRWSKLRDFSPDIWKTPGFQPALRYHGAPKVSFDKASARYLITWHSTSERPDPGEPEKFWSGMRTLYVTSKDLVHFSDPKRLFPFDMATIDVIVRRAGDRYYAILKDERYPSFDWPTGKTIRISASPGLLGPNEEPSPPISPNFREAPTLIPRPDGGGWYLYYEQYPGVSYGCSTAESLDGPWYDLYCKDYEVPEDARHGCMIPITQEQYEAITAAYGKTMNNPLKAAP